MMKPFLQVRAPEEVREMLRYFGPLGATDVGISDSLFRVLAEEVRAREDLPGFHRSTMDGYAVRSADTFGSSESAPGLLHVRGEIRMGEIPDYSLKPGQTARIWTGGALPGKADAVVMVEHTHDLDENTVEILKPVAPFEHVVRRGEDFKQRERLLSPGHRIRAQDIGLLAAMGKAEVTVHRTPVVAVISSGDEIVPIEESPPPGCMRDVNRHVLEAMIREAHAIPRWIGIAPDSLATLCALIEDAMADSDLVVVSGGSSMGSRDYVIEAIERYADSEILVHGVSVSPGKPFILARAASKAIIGLPGHPVSAMVCFEQFVAPLIRRLEGEDVVNPFLRVTTQAYLARNIASKEGRRDFVRVRLQSKGGVLVAVPVPGKSGMISAMVRADGFVVIETDCEGLYKGNPVEVHLFANWLEEKIEKEHLSGHEVTRGSTGNLFDASRQEKLSGI